MVINKVCIVVLALLAMAAINSCKTEKKAKFTGAEGEVKLVTLDPGHFHAALVQKNMYRQVNPVVAVYAPAGDDLEEHLKKIEAYNTRPDSPTSWTEEIYRGDDFFAAMIAGKKGNVMVTAGNNRKKTEYIKGTIDAGINVLADKPMAIDAKNFEILKQAFESAKLNNVLLYDIMTERFEITTMLQREFSMLPEVFGTLEKGTPENPAVTKESVHHFSKYVSGVPLKRPAWFFDVEQQGEGIVDVTTHLVDLVQWECFPEVVLDYTRDVNIVSAKRWTTDMSREQFTQATALPEYPGYLKKDIRNDSLCVYSNGEINYTLKGVHAKVVVIWNFMPPEGTGDTHYSIMRGTNANLIIRQGAEQGYKPALYIEPVANADAAAFEKTLTGNFAKIQTKFPGVELKKLETGWEVLVPQKYHVGHEAHFGQVTERYLQYLVDGKLPDWEVPNMITKYYTTTRALEVAKGNSRK
jgi:predicted dehydrogenase